MEPLQDAIDGAVLSPAVEPIVDALPLAVALGQLAPLGAAVEDPEDAIEGGPVVVPLAPTSAGLGEEVFDQGELLIRHLVAAYHRDSVS